MIIKSEVLFGLNKILDWNYTGKEQDWDLELANANRISDFIRILSNEQLTIPEKYATMSLIFASFDDLLNADASNASALWEEITNLINQNKPIYADILDYWALPDEKNDKDWFAITPLVRLYLDK